LGRAADPTHEGDHPQNDQDQNTRPDQPGGQDSQQRESTKAEGGDYPSGMRSTPREGAFSTKSPDSIWVYHPANPAKTIEHYKADRRDSNHDNQANYNPQDPLRTGFHKIPPEIPLTCLKSNRVGCLAAAMPLPGIPLTYLEIDCNKSDKEDSSKMFRKCKEVMKIM
jgi:hypothetical protein